MTRAIVSAVIAGLSIGGAYAQGASLLIDFGATTAGVSGSPAVDYRTYSPGHADGNVKGVSWNSLGITQPASDVASGLLYDDGTAATGLSIDLGAPTTTTADSLVLSWGTAPARSSALGTAANTGVYAGSSPARDGIWNASNNSYRNAVGARIKGLAAGQYYVYVAARNTNSSGTINTDRDIASIYALATPAGTYNSGTLDLGSYTPGATTSTLISLVQSTWVQNENYARVTVTMSATNPDLVIGTVGTTGTIEKRGFLNLIEVVPVPEPTGIMVLGLAGLAALRRRRA